MKKYIFLIWALGAVVALLGGHAALGAGLGLGLFVWLAVETQRRQQFSFLARNPGLQRVVSLPQLHVGFVSEHSEHALLVEHNTKLSLVRFKDASIEWQKSFEAAAQAVAVGPEGRLYYATETELVLCDAQGRDAARLAFEPPLYRQGYRILLSGDGRTLALHTPWFIQFAATDLSALGQRIRYEDAGHYLKYAALSADGRGLLLAGALLLDVDEDSTSGMEARWDYWTCDDAGHWAQAWAKAYESYNNTHLRGVAIQAGTLLAEVYQQGYEFRLYRADGTALWERPGGERALLSPDGTHLVWQNEFDETRLSSVHDKAERWKRKNEALVRLKAVDDQGRVFLVEGRRLSVLDAKGQLVWEDYFKEDPSSLALGSGGRLLVTKGDKAGLIMVPFDV